MSDLPAVKVPHPHVEVRDDLLSGSPVVRGTRVPVRRIWAWHRKGVLVATLVARYPALGPARVLDALSFAYDNQELMDADIEREMKMLDEQEREHGRNERELQQTRLPFEEKKDAGA